MHGAKISEISIRDVARYAGVSAATVSRVMNNSPKVSPETHTRVWHAINTLGYQPNYLARSMRTRSTRTLALLIRNISNPNFASIAQEAEIGAMDRGYSLLLSNSHGDPGRERNYIELLLRRRVDGIVAFVANDAVSAIGLAIEHRVPVVLAESRVPHIQADSIETDGESGVYQAVMHLVRLGHTCIGLLVGSQDITPGRVRLAGYRKGLAEAGIPYDVARVRFCDQEGSRVAAELPALRSLRPHVTAVIAGSQRLTNRALEYFQDTRIRFPHDLSFIGFDDSLTARLHSPPVSVVVRNLEELGRRAVHLLVDRIEGKLPADRFERVVLQMRLETRDSTSPVGVLEGRSNTA